MTSGWRKPTVEAEIWACKISRREGNYIAFIYRKYRPDFAALRRRIRTGPLEYAVAILCVRVFGYFLGILVALGKLSRHKLLNGVVSTYIEIIRGTPICFSFISSGWLCRIFCRAFRIRPAF